MKKFFVSILMGSMLFSGCSGKYPAMKTGALIGGTTALITTVALGTKDTNSDYAPAIAIAALILGLAGTAAGAGVGYVVDTLQEEKEMQEMKASYNIKGLQ